MRELRTKSIKIRLTETELELLKQRQEGLELATWVRQTCLAEKDKKKKIIKTADPELLWQLAKIGGNLNQIAKQANTLDEPLEKIKVFGLLAVIQKQLDELLERYQ